MRALFLILIFVFLTSNKPASDYCDGWSEGYKEGWCYEIEICLDPLVPLCPLPKLNQTSYKDGYNRGFTQGKEDRKK